MHNPDRRRIITGLPLLAGLALVPSRGGAADLPMVDEKDPAAKSLGYVADASRVDKARFKQYAAGQACATCQLYQGGKAASGACPIFPGKHVSAKGWCGSFVKKAG